MFKICLNEKTERELLQRIKSETDVRIWKRLKAIQLRSQNVNSLKISQTLDVSKDSITNWVKLYLSGGIDQLVSSNYYKPSSCLDPYQEGIKQLIKENRIPTLHELNKQIVKAYGVQIGETGLYKWCKKKSIYLSRRPD